MEVSAMKNLLNNKGYIVSFGTLMLSSFAINFCNQIYQCAFFFTLLMSASFMILQDHGRKTAFTSLFLALVVAGSLTTNMKYTIHGQMYNSIIMTSLISAFVAFTLASLTYTQENKLRILPFLAVAALSDGVIMSSYFANKVNLENVFVILAQELFFKAIYALLATVVLSLLTGAYDRSKATNL